jgi:signal transduction histidine kinase
MTDDERLAQLLRHDLRSPLAVILGRCELLNAGTGGPLTEAQTRSVDAIARAAKKMLTLLDEVADRR